VSLEAVCKVADDRSCQGSDTSLNDDVGRIFASVGQHLAVGFQAQGAVAFHDPGRDIGVALPGGVLHDDAVFVILGLLVGKAYAFIVVQVFNGNNGMFLGDVSLPDLGGSSRHSYDSLLSETVGRPGDAAAVIAVGCRVEGGLPDLLAEFGRGEHLVRQIVDRDAGLLRNVFRDGERAAQNLEGIQPETVRLVFYVEGSESEVICHADKLVKRSDLILGKTSVEMKSIPYIFFGHDLQPAVVRFGNLVRREDEFFIVCFIHFLLFSLSGPVWDPL